MSDTNAYRGADRLLLRLLRQGGGWNWVLFIAGLLGTIAYIVFPAVLGGVVDAVLNRSDPDLYVITACALVAVFVVTDAAGELAVTAASARATAWLRHSLLHHVLALGPRRPTRFTPGEVTARLVGNTAEAGRVTPMATWCVTSFVPSLVLLYRSASRARVRASSGESCSTRLNAASARCRSLSASSVPPPCCTAARSPTI